MGEENQEQNRTEIQTEVVCFIPYTPDSNLCRALQKQDDKFAALHRGPRIWFVERLGPTIQDELSRSDPWAADYICGNQECLPCRSRAIIKEEKKLKRAGGGGREGSKR